MTNPDPIVLGLAVMSGPNAIESDCGTTLNSIKSCGNTRPNSIGSAVEPNLIFLDLTAYRGPIS